MAGKTIEIETFKHLNSAKERSGRESSLQLCDWTRIGVTDGGLRLIIESLLARAILFDQVADSLLREFSPEKMQI